MFTRCQRCRHSDALLISALLRFQLLAIRRQYYAALRFDIITLRYHTRLFAAADAAMPLFIVMPAMLPMLRAA